jgi:hypothetical protein
MLAAGVCLIASALSPPAAPAAAKTLYVVPHPAGSGLPCTQTEPCKLEEAVNKSVDGDTVSVGGGEYTLPSSGITVEDEIDLGGHPGERPVLLTTKSASVHVPPTANATIHDLALQGEGSLVFGSGVADRISVTHLGLAGDACELEKGTTLKDSVCWTVETNEEEEQVSDAISIEADGENQDKTVFLRNVTAIASTALGDAIFAEGASGAHLVVDATNVIAHAGNGVDVHAKSESKGLSETHVNISHSDFATFVDDPSRTTVTPPGTDGNTSAAPSFVAPAQGDFHLEAASAGIDGGIADALVGPFDLDGNGRAQPGCFGAAGVPDMGAYERAATATCPPPPPPPPPPFEARKPVFRILKLNLNKRAGGGSLQIEVPSAGTISLTGSGVKLVRRRSAAPGDLITLPIQPWAITRVRLKKRGKTRVHLVVVFEPASGPSAELSRAVLLRKNGR